MITQEQIFEKYPDLYRENSLRPDRTCMCWGLEVPKEWLPVIDKLSDLLENLPMYGYRISDEDAGTVKPKCIAKQVKIKFGQLRFYYEIDTESLPEDLVGKEREVFFVRTQAYINGAIAMASELCEKERITNENL